MKTEKVMFKSEDGINISGIIQTPNNNLKGLIVLCHGLGGNKDEWENIFVDLAGELCRAGFKVLRFDFRGHGESGLESEQMTIEGELMDLKAVVSQIAGENSKVGLLGYSFGTQSSLLFSVDNPDRVSTLVLWAPVLDFYEGFLTPELIFGKEFFEKGGYEALGQQGYITLNNNKLGKELFYEFKNYKPYEKLKRVKCPVLTIHGTKDKHVAYWPSEKYGKPNEKSKFLSVDAEHGLHLKRSDVIRETVNWFEEHMS